MTITNINNIQLNRCVVDELHVRSATDSSVDLTSTKNPWQIDTYLLAKFQNSLSAGTIDTGGLQITQFAIQRRELTDTTNITLGYVPYQQAATLNYTDYTQGNRTYIYSIVPVTQNGLLGQQNSVQIDSDFVGFWLVDKDTNNILGFDQFLGGNSSNGGPMVSTQLVQGRIEVQNMSSFPSIYYLPTQYHKFSLQAVFTIGDNDRSNTLYQNILNNFVIPHKSCLVKGSDGSLYVCDISNPRREGLMNSYKGFDFITVTLDMVEIMKYSDYMSS